MKRRTFLLPAVLLLVFLTFGTAWASVSFSSAWYQSGNSWCVLGPDNRQLRNAWFCDDAVAANGKNVWYLIDANGSMVTSPLVKDGTGNYYSLETQHNGYYGALRYQSGWYDGIYISFSQSHNGTFGAITNQDAIEQLQEKYGCSDVSHINNSNCYYSSAWVRSSSSSGSGSDEISSRTITYYTDGKRYASKTKESESFTVINCSDTGFLYWEEQSTGDRYDPGDEYYFDSDQYAARLNAVYQTAQEEHSLTYFIDGKVYRTVTESGNTTTVIPAPTTGLDGRTFLNWRDDKGNRWEPGEIYTFYDNIDFMQATFEGEM